MVDREDLLLFRPVADKTLSLFRYLLSTVNRIFLQVVIIGTAYSSFLSRGSDNLSILAIEGALFDPHGHGIGHPSWFDKIF